MSSEAAGSTATATTASAEALPKFSLDVLDLVTTAQAQNGLRHKFYERYTRYCTSRLARVRHAKAVNFLFGGKGVKKFTPKDLSADMVSDVRHLHIPLMSAERAWSQFMKLKADYDELGGAEQRHRYLHRLRKAVKWADLLDHLAAERGDARTVLDACAYAAGMRATEFMELKEWAPALENLMTAKGIYEQLAAAAGRRQKEVLTQRLEELAPIERFCRYSMNRAQGARATAAAAGAAAPSAVTAGVSDKLAAALAEAGSAPGSAGSDASRFMLWRGAYLPITNEKMRSVLAVASNKAEQVALADVNAEGLSSTDESVFLDIQSRYDDAASIATADAARAAKDGKAALAADNEALADCLRFYKLRFSVDRNGVLVNRALAALTAAVSGTPDAAAAVAPRKAGSTRAASAPALGAAPSTHVAEVTTSNPWLAVSAGVVASNGLAGTTAYSTARIANAPASSAALAIANIFERSIKALDEMINLAGREQPAGTADAPAPAAAAAAAASADTDLLAALAARRQVVTAWRAYYMALSYLYACRYADATVMLNRVQERADAALEACRRAAPASLKAAGGLPARAVVPTHATDATMPACISLSGLSGADVTGLRTLQDRVAQQTVTLQSTALLHQLGAKSRPDGGFDDIYTKLFADTSKVPTRTALPARLVRSARPSSLLERVGGDGAGASSDAGMLHSSGVPYFADATTVATWPPAPQPTPFKPLVLDLVLDSVAYPDVSAQLAAATGAVTKGPAVAGATAGATPAATSSAPAAAAAPSGGLFGWFKGS